MGGVTHLYIIFVGRPCTSLFSIVICVCYSFFGRFDLYPLAYTVLHVHATEFFICVSIDLEAFAYVAA